MQIAIVGVGGMGGFFGAKLAASGEDVSFVARGATLAALQTDGLILKSRTGETLRLPVRATADPAEIGPVALVVFCVKAYQHDQAESLVPPLVGPETVVMTPQNGIDNEDRLAQLVGVDHVIGTTVLVSAAIESPGVVTHLGGPGVLRIGELAGGLSDRIERLREVFARAGFTARSDPAIRIALWEKFVGICGLSGVTALTRLPVGTILAHAATTDLLRATMREVAAVGRARGVPIPAETDERYMDEFRAAPPGLRGSMAHDLDAGRPLELATLNGTVVRLGEEQGVDTPCNRVITAALEPFAHGAPAQP